MTGQLRVQASGKYTPKQHQIKKKPALPTGFIIDEVDDPYEEKNKAAKPVKIIRRSSDNPLLLLQKRGLISQAQFVAGHKYMAAHMVCTGQTGQGVDYSRQRVDCSSAPMTLTEKQMHASDTIKNANRQLCADGHNEKSANEAVLRMQKIAGEGHSVSHYCRHVRGLTSGNSISKQLGFLRDDLSVLAKFWGLER